MSLRKPVKDGKASQDGGFRPAWAKWIHQRWQLLAPSWLCPCCAKGTFMAGNCCKHNRPQVSFHSTQIARWNPDNPGETSGRST
jgi:hypothetical protein